MALTLSTGHCHGRNPPSGHDRSVFIIVVVTSIIMQSRADRAAGCVETYHREDSGLPALLLSSHCRGHCAHSTYLFGRATNNEQASTTNPRANLTIPLKRNGTRAETFGPLPPCHPPHPLPLSSRWASCTFLSQRTAASAHAGCRGE